MANEALVAVIFGHKFVGSIRSDHKKHTACSDDKDCDSSNQP